MGTDRSTSSREDRRDRAARRAREDILDAALRVAARKDVASVRVEEIAEEAGYAPGSLYTYFESKEELLAEAFARLNDRLLERLGDPPDGSFEEGLRALQRRMFEVANENRGLFTWLLGGGLHRGGRLGERCTQGLLRCREDFIAAFNRWMKVGLERGELTPSRTVEQHTLAFMGISHGYLAHWLLGGSASADLADETDAVIAAFLDGARRRYSGAEGPTGEPE